MINFTSGSARERVAADDVEVLKRSGALIVDSRRQRPRYFDGRFLAARDLTREQQYFLTRQADIGRAGGSGVVTGLTVSPTNDAHTLKIEAGHGVTGAGELVMLPRAIEVRLADLVETQNLSSKFGLARIPVPPARTRTGLFVLALRPVEFSANPIGAYPTSITGPRSVEDGDVVEATAVVLVPYTDDGGAEELDQRRGRVAREIFATGVRHDVSSNLLPVALLALQNNTLVWLDPFMVRREVGSGHADILGLGFAPRAQREAHLLQYQAHLADVVRQVRAQRFAAATYFPALPPAGPLPPGVIDPADFTQSFFPAEIDVDLSLVPEDELPALLEESLLLPPIDLAVGGEALESTSVLILIPLARADLARSQAILSSRVRTLPVAAPGLIAKRRPLEMLRGLTLPRLPVVPLPEVLSPAEAEWQRLVRTAPQLWYLRRRNLAYRDDVAGAALNLAAEDASREATLRVRIDELGLRTNFTRVLNRASTRAAADIVGLLSSPKYLSSPTLMASALHDLGTQTTLDQGAVLATSAKLAQPGVGEGLARLESVSETLRTDTTLVKRLADTGKLTELDVAARTATDTQLAALAASAIKPVKPTRPGGTP